MTGEYYDRALALAEDDPDLIDSIHEILRKEGISEEAYAQAFALVFYKDKADDETSRISCSEAEKVWKRGGKPLSDVKLFSALNQCCDLVHNYVLASWENCVLSAWASKREIQKSEKDMEALESLAHAKNILALAASRMPDDNREPRINFASGEEAEPSEE